MRSINCAVAAALLSSAGFVGADNLPDALAAIGIGETQPVAEIQSFTESLWGVTIADPYRYMEALDAGTLN